MLGGIVLALAGVLLFQYSIPRLLGEDTTPTLDRTVTQLIARSERMLAYAIGRSVNPVALTRLLRVMKRSRLVPKGRIPAILLRVPFTQVRRLAEYLKTFLPRTWRSRMRRYKSMMATWMSRNT